MTATDRQPVTAGFDADGNWHIPGGDDGGQFARKGAGGWSYAKAAAIRALRGAFAHDLSKANPDGVWLEAADDYLSRLGIAKGHAVKVRYGDAAHAIIDAVHPDGGTRPVKVKWERFADTVPLTPEDRWLPGKLTGDLMGDEEAALAVGRRLFDHDLGGGYTSAVTATESVLGRDGLTFTFHGEVQHNGQAIGYFTRNLSNGRRDAGPLVLTNDIIGVGLSDRNRRHRGKGVGLRFVAASNAAAAAAGVDEVRLVATTGNNTNGAYTWARAGYRWENGDTARRLGERLLKFDPSNEVGKRLVEGDPNDPTYPQPADVAADPKGAELLKGGGLRGPYGTVTWRGVLRFRRSDAERVETPTVTKNTTKGALGRGQATAARVRDAGGTGQAVVADGYLARHGHPKGSTATVTYVDDVYADVHPATPDGRTVRSKWSHFSDDAPEPHGPSGDAAASIDLADWETIRPWEVQRDESTLDPSDLLLHGERAPAWLRFESGHGQEAAHRGDHIVVTPKFFDLPESARRATMYHEAGHGLSDAMLADGSAFDLMDHLPSWGNLNGQTTPGEVAAEAYSILWTEPEWLDENAPGVRDIMRAKAAEHRFPLPDTPSPADRVHGAASQEWYDKLVAENPTLTHASSVDRVESILANGLVPNSERQHADGEGFVAAEGRVYLGPTEDAGWLATMAGLDNKGGFAQIDVDTALLDRTRIVPDEDMMTVGDGDVDPAEFGIPMPLPGEDRGEWATRVRLGEQPGVVEAAWDRGKGGNVHTLAHVGPIPPEAIRKVTIYGADYTKPIRVIERGDPDWPTGPAGIEPTAPVRVYGYSSEPSPHMTGHPPVPIDTYHAVDADGRRVGIMSVYRNTEPVTIGGETFLPNEIEHAEVAPDKRGQGIARALYDAATRDAGAPPLHSRKLTPDGLAFAQAVGGPTVDGKPLPDRATKPADALHPDQLMAAGYKYPDSILADMRLIPDGGTPKAAGPAAVELHDSPFDADRYPDSEILDWLAKPGLSFPESEAMDLHSAKLAWLTAEGQRRGWSPADAAAATAAIDEALDKSSDTLVWSRAPLAEAAANVAAGRVNTDLERGVVAQQAFTDAVWQARYGDAETIPVSRIVADGDPARSTPGVPTDGVSSWVVRENEQQVIDWFTQRGLEPQLIRGDLERGQALMLPWGEGRYRSDYVRIKGEVLAGPAPAPPVDTTALVRDLDSTPAAVGDALYHGSTPDGHKITYRSATDKTVTGGPPHAPVSSRVIRVVAGVTNPDGTDGGTFVHEITVATGTDGDPHVSVSVPYGADPSAVAYADVVADRIDADEVAAYSPSGFDRPADATAKFIADGWKFHPNIDRYTVRSAAEQMAHVDPDHPLVKAWLAWDGNTVADIPGPEALTAIDPDGSTARRDLRNEGLRWLSYLGVHDRTGRRRVPDLPEEGAVGYARSVEWADIENLPDGTIVRGTRADGTGWHQTVNGPYARALGRRFAPSDDYKTEDGRYPQSVEIERFASAPLPGPPEPPDPVPGVKVARSTVPALPLWHPGQIVDAATLRKLPTGVRYRAINDLDRPLDGDDSFDMQIVGPALAAPAHNIRYDTHERLLGLGGRFMLTAVPDRPVGASADVGPIRGDENVRVRNALVETARRLKVEGGGVRAVEPFAAGAVHPADWVLGVGQDRDRRVAAPGRVLEAGYAHWAATHFPDGAGAEPYGPLWRLPGRSDNGNVVWSTTPIDGVDPEVIPAVRVSGALADDKGILLFGAGYTPTRWEPPKPSPLTDTQVQERLDRIAPPPPAPLDTIDLFGEGYDTPAKRTRLVSNWLANPDFPYLGMKVRTGSQANGASATGPTRSVRITTDENGVPTIVKYPYVIDAPELDLDGASPDDLVLPVEDPRLPAVIDALWWKSATNTGRRFKVESQLIAVGSAPSVEPGMIEPKIARTLTAASERLRSEHTVGGTIRLAYADGRYTVTADGTPVPSADVHYLTADGDATVAYVNRNAAALVRGPDAVTPDYTMDPDWSWDEKAQHLAAQRVKLLAGMPGARLDHMFAPPADKIETGEDPLLPVHTVQMERAQAIAEYGQAVSNLVLDRRQQIEANSARDADHRGGTRPRGLQPNHAKALAKTLDQITGSYLPVSSYFNDPDEAQIGTNPWVRHILSKVASGEVHVSYRQPSKPAIDTDEAKLDSLARVSIFATTTGSLVDQRRGAWMEVTIAPQGTIHNVRVHAADAHRLDTVEYAHDISLLDSEAEAEQKLTKRLRRTAADIAAVANADPRPTLSELAFTETMESLGIDMGTDPSIKVGKTRDRLVNVGRANTAETYAAKIGLAVYPRDWTSTVVGRPQVIQFPDSEFYRNGGGDNTNGSLLNIPDPRKHPQHRDTLVHEFGHTMERTVPGLTAAEAWYLTHRVLERQKAVGREKPTQSGHIHNRDVYVVDGGFTRSYTGRVYNTMTIAGNDSYEVFTTAMEAILSHPAPGEDAAYRQVDEGLYQWVLGILTLIRPYTEEVK